MGDQTKAQGSADRAEKLRGLSDRDLVDRLYEAQDDVRSLSMPRSVDHAWYDFAADLRAEEQSCAAEWERRCAEREAQESELERLRKQMDEARFEASELTSEINAQGWSARCWNRLQTLNGLLVEVPQPQDAELSATNEEAQ